MMIVIENTRIRRGSDANLARSGASETHFWPVIAGAALSPGRAQGVVIDASKFDIRPLFRD